MKARAWLLLGVVTCMVLDGCRERITADRFKEVPATELRTMPQAVGVSNAANPSEGEAEPLRARPSVISRETIVSSSMANGQNTSRPDERDRLQVGAVALADEPTMVALPSPKEPATKTGKHEDHFTLNDRDYPIVDIDDFLDNYEEEQPGAIVHGLKNHKAVLQELSERCRAAELDPSAVFDNMTVYCRKCGVMVPKSVLLSKMMDTGMKIVAVGRSDYSSWSGEECPYCRSVDFVTLGKTKIGPGQSWSITDHRNLVRYYRFIGDMWWEQHEGNAICDSCNDDVPHGEGAVTGAIRNGRLYTDRLYCNECFQRWYGGDDFLRRLQANPDHAGHGLLHEVRGWAAAHPSPEKPDAR